MEINEVFEYSFSFSQENVNAFAKLIGDNNPIHIDRKQARKSIFKKRIMHGFLSASVFSKVFGTIWPGNGAIYLSQNLNFIKPMYASEIYLAKFEVLEILAKNKFLINTIIKNTSDEETIDGNAIIQYDDNIRS
tara:strand:- start:2418 stop:2819 length:402 start_codon:yes stop_codon:yes gene_type:complete